MLIRSGRKKKTLKTLLENCDYSDQVGKFSTSISVHIGFSIHDLELSVYIGQDGWAKDFNVQLCFHFRQNAYKIII